MKLENIPAANIRPQRWHLLYFALAGFDALTVCGSLWLPGHGATFTIELPLTPNTNTEGQRKS